MSSMWTSGLHHWPDPYYHVPMNKPLNANIYEYLENGGNVYDDIADMSLSEMEDYFGDLDPVSFL